MRVEVGDADQTELDRVWGTRPRFYELFMMDYNRSIARPDPQIIELCRLRMAEILGSELDPSLRYEPAREAGLEESKIADLRLYCSSDKFSEKERACISFAELFAIQSSAITDEDCERLQEHITPTEFVYLTKALGLIDQLQRSCVLFDVRPDGRVPSKMEHFTALASTKETTAA